MADGRVLPIEALQPGDRVASVHVPGLEVDVPYRAQYHWLSEDERADITPCPGRVASVRLGEHEGFVVVNRRIKATPEHPFLVRRAGQWGFVSAELLEAGDRLLGDAFVEEPVESVVRVDTRVRTVAVYVPGTNTFSVEGVWAHNDMPVSAISASSSGSSGKSTGSESGLSSGSSSGSSGKNSGSSFTTSSSGAGTTNSGTILTFMTALTNSSSMKSSGT